VYIVHRDDVYRRPLYRYYLHDGYRCDSDSTYGGLSVFERGWAYATNYELPPPPTIDDGWRLLAEGYFEESKDVFIAVGDSRPYDAPPQVGYSLATGMLGSHAAALEAMRSALRFDPGSVRAIPDDPRLVEQIRVLRGRYREMARLHDEGAPVDAGEGFRPGVDSLFMAAALGYMLHDDAMAFFAVDTAIRRGDTDDSAFNLKGLLDQVLYDSIRGASPGR
jgi:hypothetical protein